MFCSIPHYFLNQSSNVDHEGMQRRLYLGATQMALVSVLPERATLSGTNFNTTDSTKLGGVDKANSTATTSSSPILRLNLTSTNT